MIKQRRNRRVAVLLSALVLVAAACGDDDEPGGAGNGDGDRSSITIAAEQEITNFNQNTFEDNQLWGAMIVRLIWPQFSYQTPDFELAPGFIADGPAEVVSQDPFTVRWTIRDDAVWSDGTPVSSDDLAYYWESCNGAVDPGEPSETDPESGEEYSIVDCVATDGYNQITEFTKVDEKTAEAVFAQPIAEYAALFSSPMPPAHLAREAGADAWTEAFRTDPQVSAGPYQLADYDPGASLTLEKNPEFFGPEANLDTIVFRFFGESGSIPDALANDEVDVIYSQPQLDLLDLVSDIDGVTYELNSGPQWEHLTYNLANPALADVRVRQALALGIDRAEIVDTLMRPITDEAEVLNNRLFVNTQADYVDNAGEFAERDLEDAGALLDEAGWVMGDDGVRTKDGESLSLRIITTGGNALRESIQELLQAQFAEFGAELTIDNRPGEDAGAVFFGGPDTAGDWDIALFAWTGTVTSAISNAPLYATGAGGNAGGFSDPEVDALFEQAVVELDDDARADLVNEIDARLWDGMPNLPLFQKPSFIAYSDAFTNIVDNTTSEGFTWNAEEWAVQG